MNHTRSQIAWPYLSAMHLFSSFPRTREGHAQSAPAGTKAGPGPPGLSLLIHPNAAAG